MFPSTYKFKRAFFRHGRRIAPKFGTHVRIETRLALTKKNYRPHPRGVYGVIVRPFVRRACGVLDRQLLNG